MLHFLSLCIYLIFAILPINSIFSQNINNINNSQAAITESNQNNVNNLAQSNPYNVADIIADATAKSGSDAKIIATNNARRKGLATLFSRLNIDIKSLDKISDAEILQIIRSEQLDNEKISSNSYYAVFNIKFSKKFLIHILKKKNIKIPNIKTNNKDEGDQIRNIEKDSKINSKTDVKTTINKSKILILSAKKQDNKVIIWENENDWRTLLGKTWQTKNANNEYEIDIVELKNDIINIEAINQSNFDNLQYGDVEPIILRNKASSLYIATFSFDNIENKVKIQLDHFAKNPKKPVILSFVNVKYLKYNDLTKEVANRVIDYIIDNEEKSKDDQKITDDKDLYYFEIEIQNFEDWITINQKLINSGLVANISLKSINKNQTIVTANYLGNKAKINDEFKEINLIISKKSDTNNDNYFTITINKNSSN
jgi:hypothetical protein